MPELKVATFDRYGTLVDSEGGLGAFLYDLARRSGDSDPEPGGRLSRHWEEIQSRLVRGPWARAQAAGLRLAIVSNTDRYIMDETVRQLRPLEFEAVVVAEDARAYKPDTRPFTRVLHALEARPEESLHVAGNLRYDIAPAASLGFRTAWVNRSRELAAHREALDHEWDSLWSLSELVEA